MKKIVILILVIFMTSCGTVKYVPVESVRTEYRDREIERVTADTVVDTRFVLVKGDTVIEYRDRVRIKRMEVRDTCFIELRDTVQVPYPVECQPSLWENTKMKLGGVAIESLVVVILIAGIWFVTKKWKS